MVLCIQWDNKRDLRNDDHDHRGEMRLDQVVGQRLLQVDADAKTRVRVLGERERERVPPYHPLGS